MVSNGQTPLAAFLAQHRTQLEGTGVPQVNLSRFEKHAFKIHLQIYWPTLLNKLEKQQFDAGNAFSILQVKGDKDVTAMGDTRQIDRGMICKALVWHTRSKQIF